MTVTVCVHACTDHIAVCVTVCVCVLSEHSRCSVTVSPVSCFSIQVALGISCLFSGGVLVCLLSPACAASSVCVRFPVCVCRLSQMTVCIQFCITGYIC